MPGRIGGGELALAALALFAAPALAPGAPQTRRVTAGPQYRAVGFHRAVFVYHRYLVAKANREREVALPSALPPASTQTPEAA